MGEVELENTSPIPIEIPYSLTPLQHLDLVVIGPQGTVVSRGHFSDRFSPSLEPSVLKLLPGEKYTAVVSLLSTVPPQEREPGEYSVRAVYDIGGEGAQSEPVGVSVLNYPE
jgi:hypothetical protein